MTEVRLAPYMDDMVWEFAEAVGEEGPIPLCLEDVKQVESLKDTLGDVNAIMRGFHDAQTGEFVGYCQIRDMRMNTWELGLA